MHSGIARPWLSTPDMMRSHPGTRRQLIVPSNRALRVMPHLCRAIPEAIVGRNGIKDYRAGKADNDKSEASKSPQSM